MSASGDEADTHFDSANVNAEPRATIEKMLASLRRASSRQYSRRCASINHGSGNRLDPDAARRAKRDRRQWYNGPVPVQFEPKPTNDRGEDQHGLHHGKLIADANAGPAAERDIGEARQRPGEFVAP